MSRTDLSAQLAQLLKCAPSAEALTGAMKQFVAQERERLLRFHAKGLGGIHFSAYYTKVIDVLLGELFNRVAVACELSAQERAGVGLLALGGYGRSEMGLYSDIDVMLLYRADVKRERVESVAARVFTPLWDLGFQVGNSVRELDACVELMAQDAVTAAAMLDARNLTCDRELNRNFHETVRLRFLHAHGVRFLGQKIAETASRHAQYGDSPCMREPNVKESAGGLRDAHLFMWMQMVMDHCFTWKQVMFAQRQSLEELYCVTNALDFVLRVRNEMHRRAGRRNDVLDSHLQRDIAAAFGYETDTAALAVEKFMRDYYQAANEIYRLTLAGLEQWEKERVHVHYFTRRQVNEFLVDLNGRLELMEDEFIRNEEHPIELWVVFAQARARLARVSRELQLLIRNKVNLIDDRMRNDSGAARLFMETLKGEYGSSLVLRDMYNSGFLGEYIPEFGALTYLIQHDPYHVYTADEHTLKALEYLDEIFIAEDDMGRWRQTVLARVERKDLLRLSILLHDIGKAVGGAHEDAGLAYLPGIAQRLHLAEDDAQELHFLMKHHSLLLDAAEGRHWRDAEFIKSLRHTVGVEERLHMLYLAAYCDLRAVGKRVFSKYKDDELRAVYETALEAFTLPDDTAQKERFRNAVLAQLNNDIDIEEAQALFKRVPERYLLEIDVEEALVHIGLMQEFHLHGAAVAIIHHSSHTDVWIAAKDAPGRFAQVVGTLAGRRLDILSASAYTRHDAVILDRFRVANLESDGSPVSEKTWLEVRTALMAVLKGEKGFVPLVESRRNLIRQGRRAVDERPTRVRMSNKLSSEFTVIDVTTQNRIGLLYDIAMTLSGMGLDIHFAKVSTRAGIVTDVFYVTRGGKKVYEESLPVVLQNYLEGK